MFRGKYPTHGRWWSWRQPLTIVCKCGLDTHPCIVTITQRRQAARR